MQDKLPGGSPENDGQTKVTVLRRYTFKLYPTKAQDAALERQTVLLARLWNAALEQRENQWRHECQRKGKGERKGISKFDQSRELKFIRANDPEYAAMSASSLELCIASLDDAFSAFYRRAKGGAGKSSGYPLYKASKPEGKDWRTYHHDTIWHRDHRKGWRLDKAGKHWRIYAKGVPGTIKARGRFPVDLDRLDLRDMRIMRRDNAWHCSIVVRLEPRMQAGHGKHQVTFDLIDEFATVKTIANGQCLPGWDGVSETLDEQISQSIQEVDTASAAQASESEADDRSSVKLLSRILAAQASESEADDRIVEELGEDAFAAQASESDARQSRMDSRFKKGSWRWREERRILSRRQARDARRRADRLHRLTTGLVRRSSELLVICPAIKEHTKSARGNERNHGAAVKTVAMLNRHVLGQAPAAAIQMLEYKAAEAGIPFARVEPHDHDLAISRELPDAVKAHRKLNRQLRKEQKNV